MEMKYHSIGCCMGLIIGFAVSTYTMPKNQLQTAFHHRVAMAKNGAMPATYFLELGKLILSFLQEPVFDVHSAEMGSQGMRERTFFFPLTTVQGPSCQAMLTTIQEQQSPFYTLSFSQTENPSPGFLCTVRYNSGIVGLTYAAIEAEGRQRRLIITFYKSRDFHTQILQTAARKARPGVIVDCGHGGDDSGAQGYLGLLEKDINLEIGILVATLLRHRGFDVFLTRTTDVFVALDERTLMHEYNSDALVFISIHANAAPNKDAAGIETFFFDVDKSCPIQKGQGQTTVSLMRTRCLASESLARCIHEQVMVQARRQHAALIDREVKPAFLQVLAGAAIPAALIELGFLTNEKEAVLMNNKQYRAMLATGLCEGIVQYFKRHIA